MNRRKIEGAFPLIIAAAWSLDGKIDVFEHGEQDLAQDLPPDLQAEDVHALLEHLEEGLERLLLVLI